MNKLVTVLIVFLLFIFSFMQIDLRLSELVAYDNIENIFKFLAEFFPPHTEKDFLKAVLIALWETLAISIVGTLLSAIFGLILAYFSSEYTDTLVGKISSDFCKFLLNVLRSIPELVWAALLIISAGLGPFAGCLAIIFHTTGVLGRLFSDALENVPPEAPRVLRINGVNPEEDFKRTAYSGAHDATVASVGSGKVQAGALNIKVWEKLSKENKVPEGTRVFYTTPFYYDYNWSVHKEVSETIRQNITKAFLKLSNDTEVGKRILELQRAPGFIATDAENYGDIENAARKAGLLK